MELLKTKCSIACNGFDSRQLRTSRGGLPRKSKAPRESYPNVDVIYDSVTMPDGKRLRSIITKPRDAKEKLPVIFLTGWLSCDSVEAPADTKDTIGLILRGLAQTPGFCLFKIDKPGCGDSEGDCSQTDFDTELAGYRAAFRALKNHDFIDSDRVYIFGSSNGGGFAPLVPETESEQAQVRGYITIGGWVKTWFEHMLDIERRRFALMKKSPGEVTDRIKGATTLYYEWLIKGRSVPEILRKAGACRTMARGERPNASLRTTAEVLSRLAEAESRRRLVPRESPGVNLARTIRLDHGPRRF